MLEAEGIESVLKQVEAWASARQIPLVSAYISERGSLPLIRLHSDVPNAPEKFTTLLERLGVRLIAHVETRLDLEMFDEAVESLSAEGVEEQMMAEARLCRRYIGTLAAVEFQAVVTDPPAIVTFGEYASWFSLMFDTHRLVGARRASAVIADPEYERLRKDREQWTRARRTEVARQVASDSRFPACKTEASRVHLLSLVLQGGVPEDDHIRKEIAREAKAIYDLEVKPSR